MTARRRPWRHTTTSDIAVLRTMAAAGSTMTQAARRLGMTETAVRYWNIRLGLDFGAPCVLPPPAPVAAANPAAARLTATMHRLADARAHP